MAIDGLHRLRSFSYTLNITAISWKCSSVVGHSSLFFEKPDANRVSRARFCIRAKEGTITPKHTKRSKSSRNWTIAFRKEPRKLDRTHLNLKPASTEAEELGNAQISRPVSCTSIDERVDVEHDLETALQCEHFQKCSGCTHEWSLDQPVILKEVKSFFDDHCVPDFTFTSGNLWEWRCRGKLAVRGRSENPQIGLYQEGTHNVVDIPSCRAHHPRINSAIQLLKEAIRELNVQPYDEVSGIGDLRYVQMALTTYNTSLPSAERYSNGKVQIALVWNSRSEISFNSKKLASLSKFLWEKGGPMSVKHFIHSVWANFQTSSSNIIFGGRWRHLVGEKEFWEHIGGVDICLAPASFGQANTQAFNSLLYKLGKYVKYGSSVVELYAGVGIIGLSLASSRKCRSVKCVEINKESKLPFEKSLARLPKSLDCSISWHCADVSVAPIHWLEGSDVVLVDPPRKGLDASVIDALQIASLRGQAAIEVPNRVEKRPWLMRAQKASVKKESKTNWDEPASWPEALIYVSCGWESFIHIVWGQGQRYWRWVSRADSRFQDVPELIGVHWLEIKGGIDCRLLSADTQYRVLFELKFGEDTSGWNEPIKFSLTTPEGQEIESKELVVGREAVAKNELMEGVAGEFRTSSAEDICDEDSYIEFCMTEVVAEWKGGLVIHGVRIEAKST